MTTLASLFPPLPTTSSQPKELLICLRTGLTLEFKTHQALGAAWFSELKCHPYFSSPENIQRIRNLIASKPEQATTDLLAAMIIYKLTQAPSLHSTPTLYKPTPTLLSALNLSLSSERHGFLLRLYKEVYAANLTQFKLSCSELQDSLGLDKAIKAILRALFSNFLRPEKVLVQEAEKTHKRDLSEYAANKANDKDRDDRIIESISSKSAQIYIVEWLSIPVRPKLRGKNATTIEKWKTIEYDLIHSTDPERIAELSEIYSPLVHQATKKELWKSKQQMYRARKCLLVLKMRYQKALDKQAEILDLAGLDDFAEFEL